MESFSQSEWFRRGWTLQELLAPHLVIFLTGDWHIMGHKGGDGYSKSGLLLQVGRPLVSRISAIAQIPENVLQDYTQSSRFSAQVKLQWTTRRVTTVEEDLSYCLLGILGVSMPAIYGEGGEQARKRLLKAVKDNGEMVSGMEMPSSGRCVSVPHGVVSTYTERAALTQELEEKLGKTYHGRVIANAVTVTGLGGTGKTQLVLNYVKAHENEYDTILWLDARTKETAKLSFERCCRALSLPVQTLASEGAVQDTPAAQMVLHWLRARSPEKKWLVVIDNADDHSWNVSGIVPHGPTGSVIVTSQDSSAARLVYGKCDVVTVDAVTTAEALALLYISTDIKIDQEDAETGQLAEQIASHLDNLPLGIDLAGARIRAEIVDGDNVEVSMRRYLKDFKLHQDVLLRNEEYARCTAYGKTVWTAWETSLSTLRRVEAESSDPTSLELLQLLAMLDRTSIQDELFRLASLGLGEACQLLSMEVPHWLQKILAVGEDAAWDDFHYRTAVRRLLRYNLVRPITGRWRGLTMHSLVQWRAREEGDPVGQWNVSLVFITAACLQQAGQADVQFRRHLIAHLPPNKRLVRSRSDSGEKKLAYVCMAVGHIWQMEGRYSASEELFEEARNEWMRTLGEEHPDTLRAVSELALTYRNQGRWKEAEELGVTVVEARSRTLGEEHPDTLTAMSNLASTYTKQGRWKEAEKLEVTVMEARSRTQGEEHPDTLTAMSNLASTYTNQGRWKEAEGLGVTAIEARSRTLGEEHPDTLTAIGNLSITCWKQQRWEEAKELLTRATLGCRRVLGADHPETVKAESALDEMRRQTI